MKHSFPPIEGIIYYAINKSENSASRMKEIFLLALELKIDFDTADVNKKGNYLCYDKNDFPPPFLCPSFSSFLTFASNAPEPTRLAF